MHVATSFPVVPMPAAERHRVAAVLGLNEQYLYQCLSGRKYTPTDHCPAIERATSGRVTCEQLRPDVAWVRVADAGWPHAEGRPCLDLATPVVRQQEAA